MEYDGGIDKNELKELLSMSKVKLITAVVSAKINEKFNELDTNKNGKIEESEIRSKTEARAVYSPWWSVVLTWLFS